MHSKSEKYILGVKLSDYSKSQVIEKIWEFLALSKCHHISTINPEFIVEAQTNLDFFKALNESDLNINDSFGIKLLYRFQNRIPGADFVYNLFELSKDKKIKFYLLGGENGIAKKAAQIIRNKYKNIVIVGAESGGEINLNNLISTKYIINRINQTEPDILLVSFGSPKQELFINFWKENLKCKIAIGVGASLDFIANKQIRAPKILRTIGLEWLWRLILYPQRWRRIFNATLVFPYLVLKNKFIKRKVL